MVSLIILLFLPRQRRWKSANTIEAIGKPVTSRLAAGGVAGPTAGVHPLLAVTGSVEVDGDQADIALAQLQAPGVHSFGAGPE